MRRSAPVYLTSLGLVFGNLTCPLAHWGSNPGEVCQGVQIDLRDLSPNRNLSGWWKAVPRDESLESEAVDGRTYLEIDEGMRPRAWIDTLPSKFVKDERDISEKTFGCDQYMDYPLVPKGVNHAPDAWRTTILIGGCSGERLPIKTDSQRVLVEVRRIPGQICLDYRVVGQYSSSREDAEEAGTAELLCFSYDESEDRIWLSFAYHGDTPQTREYQRYTLGQDVEDESDEASTTQASTTQASSTGGHSQ